MTLFASAAALVLSASAPMIATAAEPIGDAGEVEIIRTRTERDQRMTVPVRIGANDSFSFVVDTGSQTTVVARDIAERLALPPARRARVIGIGGSEMADTAIVEEMGLGRRSFSDVEVVLFEGQHIGADGIVGIDSLQRQRVLLDFAGNRLAVGSARSLGGNSGYEIVVTARRKLGQLIMTDAVIDGVRTSVVIDTGADTSIGNRALQRRLSQRGPREQASLLSVTGQRIDAEIGYPRKLAIGSIEITNLLVAFTDAPVFDVLDLADKPALLLGMRELRLFERVAIDFDSRRVFFDIPS
jgi:predicted aspartyl protease